ncbi:MAG: hypothetical protein ACK5Q0_05595, partial [Lysobacteraceae bacterium]
MQADLPLREPTAPGLRVLLSGASGLVGGKVLKRLLAAGGDADVIAPTRSPLAVSSPRLRNPVFDGTKASRAGDGSLKRLLAGGRVD